VAGDEHLTLAQDVLKREDGGGPRAAGNETDNGGPNPGPEADHGGVDAERVGGVEEGTAVPPPPCQGMTVVRMRVRS
jgi:hypothetical protein